jgi:endonuclease/exonuclease/phosphatase family metal-dependent hydrolase
VASDANPDAIPDAAPDAIPDAKPDANPDAIPDANPDAVPDSSTDAEPDSPPDAEPDVPPVLPSTLVVLTFNLRTAWASDGVNAWDNRRDLAAQVVRDAGADVMGTQEGVLSQLLDLEERLPGWAWVGEPRTESLLDEYCAIFFRASRFTLVETATQALSDTPDVKGSLFDPTQNFPRVLTWARLREKADPSREWLVVNTHFDTEDGVHARSAAQIVRTAADAAQGAPVVVTGDFNEGPGDAGYAVLTGTATVDGVTGDFVDAWIEAGAPEQGTFHGFEGVSTSGARIDWVLRSPVAPAASEAGRIDTHDGDVWPSDHFPVRVVLGPAAVGADFRLQASDYR